MIVLPQYNTLQNISIQIQFNNTKWVEVCLSAFVSSKVYPAWCSLYV